MTLAPAAAGTTEEADLVEVLKLPFVTSDPAQLATVSVDRSGFTGHVLPLALARPTEVVQVQQLLSLAHAKAIPVIPRGAGSGLAGGAAVVEPAIVLDLSHLNRILELDVVNQVAVVEAGVITAQLDAAARAQGLRYAPDPASAQISTIGGNIATNAGGLACVKYGVTRDAVRGLDVVLADGTLISTGAQTRKSVTGYDLTSLFVGSEGTLGVIVRATLALSAIAVATSTLSASFATTAQAAQSVTQLLAAGIRPSFAELLDLATLQAIDEFTGSDLASTGGALLILQTDGYGAQAELAAAEELIAPAATRIELAADAAGGHKLVEARRLALPAIEARGRVLIEDISVPLSRLAEVVERIGQISAKHGVEVFVFAHAGDGNLHPIICVPEQETSEQFTLRVEQTAAAIFSLALEVGGSVSAEHGIGLLKREWLAKEVPSPALELQHKIKAVFDPSGILNPGKAI